MITLEIGRYGFAITLDSDYEFYLCVDREITPTTYFWEFGPFTFWRVKNENT